jgi:hypothetical protein
VPWPWCSASIVPRRVAGVEWRHGSPSRCEEGCPALTSGVDRYHQDRDVGTKIELLLKLRAIAGLTIRQANAKQFAAVWADGRIVGEGILDRERRSLCFEH